MTKTLDNLTKEDWDTLFPIELASHSQEWAEIYSAEEQNILDKLGNQTILRIEHFGSTSIPGIKAKAYIDILIEIPKELLFSEKVIEELTDLGYHYFRQTGNGADYMIFVKGYNLDGQKEQVYHIHMCAKNHDLWNQLQFRDFLIDNPERAKLYEKLKLRLTVEYRNDRSGYRIAKSDFINETIAMAKEIASH